MGPQDLVQLWKEYVSQLALLLGRDGNGCRDLETSARVTKLVNEVQCNTF